MRLGREGFFLSPHTLRALKTLTPRFTDFFTDFEKKNRLFCSLTVDRHFIFYIVCFEAVARELDDVSNDQLKCADVPGIRHPFNYNF